MNLQPTAPASSLLLVLILGLGVTVVAAVGCGEAAPVEVAPGRAFRPIGDVALLWQGHGRFGGRGAGLAAAGRSAGGPVVPDSKIAYDVSTKLAPFEAQGVEIDVFVDGQVVRLVGRVSNAFEADQAEEAAGAVHGVRMVVNDLEWPR